MVHANVPDQMFAVETALQSRDNPSVAAGPVQIAGRTYATVGWLCERLGISTRTFARWHATRTAPPVIEIGRQRLVDLQKVSGWLESHEIGPLPNRQRHRIGPAA